MAIGVQKERGGRNPGLTGAQSVHSGEPTPARERLSKSLNKEMDFRQSLERCAGPTGAGTSSPAEGKVESVLRRLGTQQMRRGGSSLAYVTGLSEP